MTVIAMPRELATRGKDVALGVAEELGLEVVHRELVERDLAGRLDVDQGAVHQFLEGNPSLWHRWKIDRKKLSRYTAEELLELAVKGNVVIRGWGAVTLLRSVPHVICVRVCAPAEFRVKVLMNRLDLKCTDTARREIEKNDDAHMRSAQRRNAHDWMNAKNFDLVLNTNRIPVADCVAQIKQLATSEAFSETLHSKKLLSDMLTEARLKNALSLNDDAKLLDHNPDELFKPRLRPKRTA